MALALRNVRIAHGDPHCDAAAHGTDYELCDRTTPGGYTPSGSLVGDGLFAESRRVRALRGESSHAAR